MMTFMASLGTNPSGSGIFGQPAPNNQDPLELVNNIKDREMRDFQNKANFMSDLSLKQDRQRALFNPEDPNNQLGASAPNLSQNQPKQMMVDNANQITPFQKGELGIRQQEAGIKQGELGVRQQQVTQAGKMGEERLGIQTKQEQLNEDKNKNIHEQKQAELAAKIEEANNKLTQAQAALQQKGDNSEAQLKAHKDLAAAMEERHKLELAQKDHQFEIASSQHDKTIKDMEQRMKDARNKTTTTSVNPEGTQRTTNTRSGSAAQNVIKTNPDNTLHVTGPKTKDNPNGEYDIPPDKLDHWNSTIMGSGNATP